MKGIILAGGSGTRLYPLTKVVSKQLMPIYDKPMIYYPLSSLMGAGIKEIAIISTPHDLPLFRKLLGDGAQWGLRFEYIEQPSPDGLAQALILAETFLEGEPSCLILGDNIFYGSDLNRDFKKWAQELRRGATVFGYPVRDPHRYGVVEFDQNFKALSIEEKPRDPRSNYAVPGIYFYDSRAPALARTLKPSPRGELEITDLNMLYLREGTLNVQLMGRGVAWLDTGTHESLSEASDFISVIEKRQGLKVGCVEEIAYSEGFISRQQLEILGKEMAKNEYGQYLLRISQEGVAK
jgi:glucose-1-phosphate thymidylyltransferase